MKRDKLLNAVIEDIFSGVYGNAGSVFPSIRGLSAKLGVSPATAKSVIDALREKNLIVTKGNKNYLYHREIGKDSALCLRRKKSGFIGVFVPDIQNMFFAILAKNIQFFVCASGYNAILMTESKDFGFKNALDCFEKLGVEAAIVAPWSSEKNFRRRTYPVILVATDTETNIYDKITIDNHLAGKTAADLLYKGGYEKFFVIGIAKIDENNPRVAGFISRTKELGVEFNESDLIKIGDTEDLPYKIRELVSKNSDKSIGLFCYHDILANRVLETCRKNGYGVPEKIGIVGCDNLPIPEDKIKITTIAYSVREMAKEAVELAKTRIAGDDAPKKARVIPFFVYKKNSVKKTEN